MCDLLGICFLKEEYKIIFCKSPELQCPRRHYPPPPPYNPPPHPSFTPVHQGICYSLLQSDNHLCIDVLHSKWFDQKSHVINKWNTGSQSGKWSQSENQREDCDSEEAVETSFTINNSHIQDYAHPDDHI